MTTKPKRPLLVTIDGPAGAGKTTVSRTLAEAIGYRYVDTGALYRAVALAAQQEGIDLADDEGLARLCPTLDLSFECTEVVTKLFMNGEDVSGLIRTPEMSMAASAVSARPVVREFLFAVQKEMGAAKEAVFEGRDMGTVVFPEAEVKFFLDASSRVRAGRRLREMPPASGMTLDQVEADIIQRDRNDSTRAIAPLMPAADAMVIDSTSLSIAEVVDAMRQRVFAVADGAE